MAGTQPAKGNEIPSNEDANTPPCFETVCVVDNVHCASCATYIKKLFSDVEAIYDVYVSIITHEVRVSHGPAIGATEIATALLEAAFEVHHATTYKGGREVVCDIDTVSWIKSDSSWTGSTAAGVSEWKPNTVHIDNCDLCKTSSSGYLAEKIPIQTPPREVECQPGSSVFTSISAPVSYKEKLEDAVGQFSAGVSIGGMSCGACANSIMDGIKQTGLVNSIAVNFLTHSAMVEWSGPRSTIDTVVEHIEDMGFEADLDKVHRVDVATQPKAAKAVKAFAVDVAITGMTCGSCVGTVTKGLEELDCVSSASVNLLTHSGRVEIEGDNVNQILERIDDLGFEGSISKVTPLAFEEDEVSIKSATRIVSISVDGMFCGHCPTRVVDALQKKFPDITVEKTLSLDMPVLTVTYTPRPPSYTIRSILAVIESTHDTFEASIYRPPSIEDRSKALQEKHRRQLWYRTCFVLVAAIPTFFIGMVFMTFVPPENAIRHYLEQPIWFCNISRMDWSLLILATPVMFFGADIFHKRAAKETYGLWRPGSPVPILQRFYRFGSMNLLISAGTMVAYITSWISLVANLAIGTTGGERRSTCFDTVVFLTLFILLGRCLETYSKGKTDTAVASLGKLRPSSALLIGEGGRAQSTSVELLEVGDSVSVPHGTSPPADGTINNVGDGFRFDESSLTGESTPVKKSTGDPVYAGSINHGSPVQVHITGGGGLSMLDQIIAVVREGQSKRAPMERAADALTAYFVPVITLIAIITFLVWLSLGLSGVLPQDYLDVSHMGWPFWSLEFAIAVFVVACPCGLALAAPTALFVGGGIAARYGILVKGGGEAFQEASRLNAVVFDKTGTLTDNGSLQVSDYEVLADSAEQLNIAWSLAQQLEESSNHPMGKAIRQFCQERQISGVNIRSSNIEEISGHGMQGTFAISKDSDSTAKYEAAIGNERLLNRIAPSAAQNYYASSILTRMQSSGKSIAILSLRRSDPDAPLEESSFNPVLIFSISESIRPEAANVIFQLKKSNVDVFMCTGDNGLTAHAVAETVGIPLSNVMANALPTDKATFIHEIQRGGLSTQAQQITQRSVVAFAGDGVNDAPALAAADVSIAMASGSDVAMSSANFILLNSDLNTILHLLLLSRRVFRRVKLNFGWAIVYNLCLVPIAAGVLYPIVMGHKEQVIDGHTVLVNHHWRLSPVWAALAMAMSSISVLCSSLALGIEKRHFQRLVSWGFWKRAFGYI